ncbi:polymorphic toxin type 28 domain-containing protein [Paenibacillus sp. ACRRX]|uniref:polymorphic toxin type 28 domain-containing protein n=1 Tax=Paenibacillus sp. ACRRX TaxID=2918206 RepID=UPI001EF6B525|nr:polymorphic toxin type 28 domain-containing protein [Paenibacillus sp. ACRRX]
MRRYYPIKVSTPAANTTIKWKNGQPNLISFYKNAPRASGLGDLSRAQKRNLITLDNIVNKHLTGMDFSETLRDLKGNPVPKPEGGYWNHLQEMRDLFKGLSKIKRGLEGSLQNPNLSDITRKTLQNALNKANKNLIKIENLFEPFGGVK